MCAMGGQVDLASFHQLLDPRFAHTIVLRLPVRDDDRGGGLLGNQLVRSRQTHAELCGCGRQDLEDLLVIFKFWDGRVPPRVTLALVFAQA